VPADALFETAQYRLAQADKEALLAERLRDLTRLHAERCPPYRRLLSGLGRDPGAITSLQDVPMLPVGLFKSHELRSIPEDRVLKTVTSSGTTGARVSRIHLDGEAAHRQTRTLAAIMTEWIGAARLPMIVVDARSTVADRRSFSARGAGIIGMLTFGRDHFYALDDDMRLDREGLRAWLARQGGSPVLVFGFTFMVWEHLLAGVEPGEIDLGTAVLIHSGGWKKLADRAVDNATFRAELERRTGLRRVHNFYGMAEQIGTVFVECEHGLLHAPNAADVIVRDPATWLEAADGETGLAQLVSALPESYPGHSILTEDLARVDAVDDCPCGRLGKAITILGRVPRAELRGCSDTHAHAYEAAA
jgi:hypothetical protein